MGGPTERVSSAGIYILIAVGAVMMFVGFLGCYGAIQESQCLLGTVGPGERWGGGAGLTPQEEPGAPGGCARSGAGAPRAQPGPCGGVTAAGTFPEAGAHDRLKCHRG